MDHPSQLRIFHEFWEFGGFWDNNSMFSLPQEGNWAAEKVIKVPSKKVQGWLLPDMPGQWERVWEKFGNFPVDPERILTKFDH